MENILEKFVLESRQEMSNFDIEEFKNIKNSYVAEAVITRQFLSGPAICFMYMDKSVDIIKQLTAERDKLDEFYTNIYKSTSIDDKGITISLQRTDEIEKIRPEYLSKLVTDFNFIVTKILNGSIQMSEVKQRYASNEYFDKIKSQLVKTTININDARDFLLLDNPILCKVDNIFIQSTVIPFIRKYNRTTTDLINIAINAKSKMTEVYDELNGSINSINDMSVEKKISNEVLNKLDWYKYTIFRNYMKLCSYLTSMIIRKITCLAYNMKEYINLYNTINNYFPEGELILHENVLDGSLNDIDDTTIMNSFLDNNLDIVIPHIQAIVNKKKMEIANTVANKYDYKISYNNVIGTDTYSYDTKPYGLAISSVKNIIDNLKKFVDYSKDKEMIADNILSKSGLEVLFLTKYSKILDSIADVGLYKTMENPNSFETMMSVYTDINNFEKNMCKLSNIVSYGYNVLQKIQNFFDINRLDLDQNSFNELSSFIEKIMISYKEYILELAKKMMMRLSNLTDLFDSVDTDNITHDEGFLPTDYSHDSYLEKYDEIVQNEQNIFESMMKEYAKEKTRKEVGAILVYEDGENNQQQDTNNNQNTNPSPSVETGGNNQDNNSSNTTTNNQSNNTSNNNSNNKGVIQKIKEWFQNLLNRFNNVSEKYKAKHSSWLSNEQTRQRIQNWDTTNTKITTVKYENVNADSLVGIITQATQKINSIPANNLPPQLTGKQSAAELYLFNNIPEKIGNITSFPDRIKAFYINGNSEKPVLVTYSGDEAKSKLNEIYDYCVNYVDMCTKIKNAATALTDAAGKKQQEILEKMGGSNTNESVSLFNEASNTEVSNNGTNVGISKDSKDKTRSASVVTDITRDFVSAILSVIEKKYLDYIKILDKFVPMKSDNNSNNNTNDNQTNNQNNN